MVDDDKSVAGKQFRHMIIPPRTVNRETNMKKKEEKNDKKKHHSKSKSKPTVRSTEYFRIALDYYYYYYLDAYTAGKNLPVYVNVNIRIKLYEEAIEQLRFLIRSVWITNEVIHELIYSFYLFSFFLPMSRSSMTLGY